MPRDLTDLMERATSAAPPEPHAAADIASLAARRHRRRTTGIAAGVAAVLLVAGAAGYGVTRGHDTIHEPAGGYRYGQELTSDDAVPATSLAGYRLEPWKVPSIEQLQDRHLAPLQTYLGVDDAGRLLVETVPGGDPEGRLSFDLYTRPGATPSKVPQPPSPGRNTGQPVQWVPAFGGDGRLVWRATVQAVGVGTAGYHVTDLHGGGDVSLPTGVTSRLWVSGDRVWWTSIQDSDAQGGIYYKLYAAPLSDVRKRTLVAQQVVLADVQSGVVGWITKDGRVVTEDAAAAGSPHELHVPFAQGCRMSSAAMLGLTKAFVVGPSMVALTERCGTGRSESDQLVAFDRRGRLLMHLAGATAYSLSMGDSSLLFWAGAVGEDKIGLMHYDLTTGVLSALPFQEKQVSAPAPQAAGEYVLWYDHAGGHVARFSQ